MERTVQEVSHHDISQRFPSSVGSENSSPILQHVGSDTGTPNWYMTFAENLEQKLEEIIAYLELQ